MKGDYLELHIVSIQELYAFQMVPMSWMEESRCKLHNSIQKTNVANEFLVPSTKNNELIYVVNSEIGVCICPIGMSSTPCKHQGAVSIKFHISIFNFIPSLTPDDRMIYAYIALGKYKYSLNFLIIQS